MLKTRHIHLMQPNKHYKDPEIVIITRRKINVESK